MKITRHISYLFLLSLLPFLASCDKYIDVMPKGKRIPETLADYEAFMRDEYSANYLPSLQDQYLMNDRFLPAATCRNVDNLNAANYMWKEQRDRCELNSSTEGIFDNGYGIIGIMNTILEAAPGTTQATQEEKNEVMAYCHAIRAFILFYIVNYYADAYDPTTAATTPGVPLIYSGSLGAPWHQGSVKEVYDQILADFNKAIELGVPDTPMTAIHPGRGAVEAGLARTYLSMRLYDKALHHAQEALAHNDKLFDWLEYYEEYKERIENPDDYNKITSPMSHTSVENYWFCSGNGNPNYPTNEMNISVERAAGFEKGDMKFLTRWKRFQSDTDVYFTGMLRGYYNFAGIATPEVYLIKAECQARAGHYDEAMTTLDIVRSTRIHPDIYQESSATSESEAIERIRLTKDNEMMNTMIPFIDHKRYNAEGKYPRTLSKSFDGVEYTLSPNSHLWTMVFPANSINRPGNGILTQNSK